MKNIFLFLLAIILFPLCSNGQEYLEVNGKTIDKNGDPLNGKYFAYNENGTIEHEYNYKNGLKEGEFISYYADGKLMEKGYYISGLKDGTWVRWSQDGQKIGEITFNHGIRDGKWQIWSDNGMLKYGMYYKN